MATGTAEKTGDEPKSLGLVTRLLSIPYTSVWAHMSAKLSGSTSLTSWVRISAMSLENGPEPSSCPTASLI